MINEDALVKKPTLLGERVRLVPLDVRHAEPMWLLGLDPETRRLTGNRAEFTLESVEQWCAGRATRTDRLDLAVECPHSGDFLGELALHELDPINESANFRIALRSQVLGRGLGVEAAELLLSYAFCEVRLHRVQLEVFEFNPRAIHAYEKAGFVHEGRSRQALLWEGARYDVLHMAAVRTDWRPADPGNPGRTAGVQPPC